MHTSQMHIHRAVIVCGLQRFCLFLIIGLVIVSIGVGCSSPQQELTPTVTVRSATLTPLSTEFGDLSPDEATLAVQLSLEAERAILEAEIFGTESPPTATPTSAPGEAMANIRYLPGGRIELLSVCANPRTASINATQHISAWYFGSQIEDGSTVSVQSLSNTYRDSGTGVGTIERFPGICTNDKLYLAGSAAISPEGKVMRPYFAPERQAGSGIAPQFGVFLPIEAFSQPGVWQLAVENDVVKVRIKIDVPSADAPMFIREPDNPFIWLGGFSANERAVVAVFDETSFAGDFRVQVDSEGTFYAPFNGPATTQGFAVVGETGNIAMSPNLTGVTSAGASISAEYLYELYWPAPTPTPTPTRTPTITPSVTSSITPSVTASLTPSPTSIREAAE